MQIFVRSFMVTFIITEALSMPFVARDETFVIKSGVGGGVKTIVSLVKTTLYFPPVNFQSISCEFFQTMVLRSLYWNLSLSPSSTHLGFFFPSLWSLSSSSRPRVFFGVRVRYASLFAWKQFCRISKSLLWRDIAAKSTSLIDGALRHEPHSQKNIKSTSPNSLAWISISDLKHASYNDSYWSTWETQAYAYFFTSACSPKQTWRTPYQLLNWWQRWWVTSGYLNLFSANLTISFGMASPSDCKRSNSILFYDPIYAAST